MHAPPPPPPPPHTRTRPRFAHKHAPLASEPADEFSSCQEAVGAVLADGEDCNTELGDYYKVSCVRKSCLVFIPLQGILTGGAVHVGVVGLVS
jgi:hypothetical protein